MQQNFTLLYIAALESFSSWKLIIAESTDKTFVIFYLETFHFMQGNIA